VAYRHRTLVALVGTAIAVAIAVPSLAGAAPLSDPASGPTIQSVQQQLKTLNTQNIQLVEQFNQSQIEVTTKQAAARAAQATAAQAAADYASGRAEFSATMTNLYEGGSFSATGALLSSQDGQSYLNRLETLDMISAHTAQVVASLQGAQARAIAAQKTAATLLASAQAKAKALTAQKTKVSADIAKYTALLAKLNAAQRAAFLAAQAKAASAAQVQAAKTALNAPAASTPAAASPAAATGSTIAVHATSAAAQRAVNFALAQVGKWYSWGAAGPSTYDCSGLTMMSWQAGGISLPHSAAEQYNYGTHVPATVASLQPGDLIFFYQPIGHVTIYIGNGLMVSAPETGEQVKVMPLDGMYAPITGATRLT
jgi:peptidoglycan DL-endopeptidase CwlO